MKGSSGVLLCLLIFTVFSSCHGEFINTVYTSILTPEGVIPSHGPEHSSGTAVCIYDRNASPKTLDCEVQFHIDPVHGPFYAGIYLGTPLEAGTLLFEFTTQISSNFRQIFTLQPFQVPGLGQYRLEEQEYDFLNGRWFISIRSEPYEDGALRGQLLHQSFMYAKLNHQNVLDASNPDFPLPPDSPAKGIALAGYTLFNPRRTAHFTISHSVENPIGAEIRRGKSGQMGSSDASFKHGANSPMREKISYFSATEHALLQHEQYIEIASRSQPGGEIRGQLEAIDVMPPVSFTARLDSLSMVPPTLSVARGCALFALDCRTMKMEYLIFHSVNSPVEAWMNVGDRYSKGEPLWTLSRAQSPIYGERTLNATEMKAFWQEVLFVTLTSEEFPGGEIRGQISGRYPYYAHLSGANVIPRRTTSSVGCATFRLAEETTFGRVLDYDVMFLLRKDLVPASVELIHGDEGSVGVLKSAFPKSTSPSSGTDVLLSDKEASLFATGQMFIQIGQSTTFSGANGEIRGQIYRTSSTCPFVTSLPEEPSTPSSDWVDYWSAYYETTVNGNASNSGSLLVSQSSWMIVLISMIALIVSRFF